jgi:hypothetical protein
MRSKGTNRSLFQTETKIKYPLFPWRKWWMTDLVGEREPTPRWSIIATTQSFPFSIETIGISSYPRVIHGWYDGGQCPFCMSIVRRTLHGCTMAPSTTPANLQIRITTIGDTFLISPTATKVIAKFLGHCWNHVNMALRPPNTCAACLYRYTGQIDCGVQWFTSLNFGTTKESINSTHIGLIKEWYNPPEVIAQGLGFGGHVGSDRVLLEGLDDSCERCFMVKHMTLSAYGTSLNEGRYREKRMEHLGSCDTVQSIDAAETIRGLSVTIG